MDSWLKSRVVNKRSGPMLDLSKSLNIGVDELQEIVKQAFEETK